MFEVESSLGDLGIVRSLLAEVVPAEGSAVMIEQIRILEDLRGLLAATQASVTAAFAAARRAEQTSAGLPKRRVGLGIGHEIAAAKRETPHKGSLYAGWASILTSELPHTLAALRAGETSEWRAMLVARETGWLSREDRATVDADLGPRLGALGDREVEAEARRLAYGLDPHGLIERNRRAVAGRRVGLRPEADGMTRLTALLPLAQGVATFAALDAAANSARADGDERSRGQVMADTLVERVTGQARATDIGFTVNLVMTDQALFRSGPGADEPATVPNYGPVPAEVARDLMSRPTDPAEDSARTWIRRLFADPAGKLVTMETAAREFTPAMSEFIRLRDQRCTTPWCGAPIRHIDHLLSWALGGATSLINASGKCEACNYAKEAPGWQTTVSSDGTVRVTMPTGHDSTTFARVREPGAAPPTELPQPSTDSPPRKRVTRPRPRRRTRHSRTPADA